MIKVSKPGGEHVIKVVFLRWRSRKDLQRPIQESEDLGGWFQSASQQGKRKEFPHLCEGAPYEMIECSLREGLTQQNGWIFWKFQGRGGHFRSKRCKIYQIKWKKSQDQDQFFLRKFFHFGKSMLLWGKAYFILETFSWAGRRGRSSGSLEMLKRQRGALLSACSGFSSNKRK